MVYAKRIAAPLAIKRQRPLTEFLVNFLVALYEVLPHDVSSPSSCDGESRLRKFLGYVAVRGSAFSLFLRRVMGRIVQPRLQLHSKLVRSRLVAKCVATSGLGLWCCLPLTRSFGSSKPGSSEYA